MVDQPNPPAAPPVTPPATPNPPPSSVPISSPPPADDPLVVEYADNLKTQLGDLYDAKEYDKLPLKERIATMKIIKKTLDKMPTRSEGKPPIAPEPEGAYAKVKDHVDRWKAGERGFQNSSIFAIKVNK